MDFEQLLNSITPEIYANLKRGIELGKWPDGRLLTAKQRELCMEAVINYEQRFVAETDRVGYIDKGSKAKDELCDDKPAANQEQPLKWSE